MERAQRVPAWGRAIGRCTVRWMEVAESSLSAIEGAGATAAAVSSGAWVAVGQAASYTTFNAFEAFTGWKSLASTCSVTN